MDFFNICDIVRHIARESIMKKSTFIYGSLLAALLAEGGNLTQAEINRKLTELAKSERPQTLTPAAMCYVMAAYPLERKEFTCSKCLTKTIYNAVRDSTLDLLEELRSSLQEIQKLSGNITLDDSEFCAKCNPDNQLLKKNLYFKELPEGSEFTIWQKNARVQIKLGKDIKVRLVPDKYLTRWLLLPELWTETEYYDKQPPNKICDIRVGPGKEYRIAMQNSVAELQHMQFRDYPSEPRDGWTSFLYYPGVPVWEWPELPPFPKLKWVVTVDGKTHSTAVQKLDGRLLLAFLGNKNTYKGERDAVLSVKSAIPRLQEILLPEAAKEPPK